MEIDFSGTGALQGAVSWSSQKATKDEALCDCRIDGQRQNVRLGRPSFIELKRLIRVNISALIMRTPLGLGSVLGE